ncbi:hypothetical protein B0I35DRAFT_423599 [Stachybotrys elegans]|uniref:Hexosyltransferase n=1 Tax=Stachybotrys elegans TaxID=80388 RepID=A0A8K0SVG4_9HYPO|nr:hypothetical protein B0I35DRAFT_423599 [Stachybotrys elegans]
MIREPRWWRQRASAARFAAFDQGKLGGIVGSRIEDARSLLGWVLERCRRVSRRTWIFIIVGISFLSLIFGSYLAGQFDFSTSQKPPPPPPPHAPPSYPPTAAPGQLIDWVPPDMDPIVHGVKASEGVNRKPDYDLIPFPYSPMTMTEAQQQEADQRRHPWLGAVICSAWDVKRRMMIRYTWMKLYKDVPMDQRFVISNPGPQWTQIVQMENQTYGDMIVLEDLPEDDFTANTVKTVEFYRWLAEKSPRKYALVSKLDTDLWVNARALWDRHLAPLLDGLDSTGPIEANVNHTVVGQLYYSGLHRTAFPHGAMYTATWDIVELLPTLQDEFHIIAGEDVTMAWLLMKGKQKINLLALNEAEKFEFDKNDLRPGEITAWARNTTDVTSQWHALYGKEAIGIHQLKNDNDWLIVATCFDENGVKDMPTEPEQLPNPDDKKPGYPRPWHESIPDPYWETDTDGRILVNGVWKLEAGVGRDMKKNE